MNTRGDNIFERQNANKWILMKSKDFRTETCDWDGEKRVVGSQPLIR
jgi:hypothetical protein